MNKLIFVSFDSAKISNSTLALRLDERLEIQHWFTVFQNGLLLDTKATVKEVSDTIQSIQKGLNVVCIRVDPNEASGLMPLAIGREIASRRT